MLRIVEKFKKAIVQFYQARPLQVEVETKEEKETRQKMKAGNRKTEVLRAIERMDIYAAVNTACIEPPYYLGLIPENLLVRYVNLIDAYGESKEYTTKDVWTALFICRAKQMEGKFDNLLINRIDKLHQTKLGIETYEELLSPFKRK